METAKEILKNLIRSRRSVRKFARVPIPENEIREIFENIRYMPSPTNRQCFRFVGLRNPLKIEAMKQEIVTEVELTAQTLDPDDAEKFRKYSDFFTFFEKASFVIVGFYRTFVSRLPSGGPKSDFFQGLAEIQAFGGAVAALLLELEARNFSACWMTGPLIAETRILRLLEIEEPWRLGAVIPVGKIDLRPECPKKPPVEKIFSLVFDS